jgi:RNA polymerase sigma-70 factor (ECF subfamily)
MTAHRPDDVKTPVIGTEETFEGFYHREYRAVVALVYALSGSRAAAEDVAQDAFLAAYRDWDRLAQHPRPAAWIRRVAANRAVSAWRRRVAEVRAVRRLTGSAGPPPDEMDPTAVRVWSQVRRLPKRQAQSLALRYLEDLSVEQIAEVLDCSAGSVKQHLHRGQQTLARRLGEKGGDDDR